ncbi:hypothetical protein HDU97_006531 [Phlyctochytrium planicorne]|nr:hypothetical protein HDU97_006531 [Phlyctochytrium planicorne]
MLSPSRLQTLPWKRSCPLANVLPSRCYSPAAKKPSKLFQIAVDGVAATGKTQTAKALANRLPGFMHIDSGAMYRALTLKAIETSTPLDSDSALTSLAKSINLSFIPPFSSPHLKMDNRDITLAIRDPSVTAHVSTVASHPGVRDILMTLQRRLSGDSATEMHPIWVTEEDYPLRGIVMEGRDIGTTVLPTAHLKIYLDGSTRIRAERRYKEMVNTSLVPANESPEVTLQNLEKAIIERDHRDMTRKHSPLKKADDAVVIDTSFLSMDEQVAMVDALARSRLARWEAEESR